MNELLVAVLASVALLLAAGVSEGQETRPAGDQEKAPDDAQPAQEQPAFKSVSTTDHEAIGMKYRVTAAELDMKDDAGVVRGTIFFTYYAALGDDGQPLHETQDRPITYVFNGGPGAASVWLHLGTAGPFRVELDEKGAPPPPPSTVVENQDSWLPATDLVFIDPVGTGFSRAALKKKDKDKDGQHDAEEKVEDEGSRFYGVREDVQWVGEFIRIHCTRFGRWDDPKFLAGESYGTTRAAQLALSLHDRFGLDVNGVILISTVLDFATIRTSANNPLTHLAFLPTYATVAAYHGKTEMTPQEAAEAAAEWVTNTYLPAILKGALIGDDERRQVAEQYAKFTGLPVEYVLASDLKVDPFRFMKKLLNDERKVVGRMDGRLTGYDTDPIDDTPNTDPSLTGYMGVYSGSFNDYVRKQLGFESDLAYEVLSGRVQPWNATPESTRSYSGGYLSVADDLHHALNRVPGLRLFVANGLYDLATPFHGADYTVAHLKLSPAARERITQTYYAGGHMMYHVPDERQQLGADLRAFIQGKPSTTPTTRSE